MRRAGRTQPVLQNAKGKNVYLHHEREYRLQVLDACEGAGRGSRFVPRRAGRRSMSKKNAANAQEILPNLLRRLAASCNLSKLTTWLAVGVWRISSLERDGLHGVRRNRDRGGTACPLGGKRNVGCVDRRSIGNGVERALRGRRPGIGEGHVDGGVRGRGRIGDDQGVPAGGVERRGGQAAAAGRSGDALGHVAAALQSQVGRARPATGMHSTADRGPESRLPSRGNRSSRPARRSCRTRGTPIRRSRPTLAGMWELPL